MNMVLICPAKCRNVAALAELLPLALQPVLGKPLIEHWLEQVVASGAREVSIVAADRPRQILDFVGDGARWGVRIDVQSEFDGFPAAAGRNGGDGNGAFSQEAGAGAVVSLDHLPQQPDLPLFASYAAWFAAVINWIPRAAASPNRLGVREIRPGVWAGLHTRVSAGAELRAPCWLGEHVFVGSGAILGPMAVVEDRVLVEPGAKITDSIIGPETFVGEMTEVGSSLAWGDTLVNWKLNSLLKVPDTFLLRSLRSQPSKLGRLFQVPAAIESQVQLPWKFNAKTEL
jgi:hypothetical protein